MNPALLRPDMTLQEIVVLMAAEIQRIEALDKATPQEAQELAEMRSNLGTFVAHIDQEIQEAYELRAT